GIAAAYNVPIGAALFGLEVLLGSFALELFGPMVVSCVVATVISRTLLSDHAIYLVPHYRLTAPRDLLLSLLLAPFFGAAPALYVRVREGAAKVFDLLPRRLAWLWPPLSLALVGTAAVWLPELLGNGYDTVDNALLGELAPRMLLLLPVAKMLATALTAGAGGAGGGVSPSFFFVGPPRGALPAPAG